MTLLRFIFLMFWATVAFGMPKYVAIPLEDLEEIGLVAEPIIEEELPSREPRLVRLNSQPEHQPQFEQSESHPDGIFLEAPQQFIIEDESRLKRESFPAGGHGVHGGQGGFSGVGSGHINTGYAVDYGAYTGKKGAFGWYADFPVFTPKKYHR